MECVDCGSAATGECRRCHTPLCDKHAADGWCDACAVATFPEARPVLPRGSSPSPPASQPMPDFSALREFISKLEALMRASEKQARAVPSAPEPVVPTPPPTEEAAPLSVPSPGLWGKAKAAFRRWRG